MPFVVDDLTKASQRRAADPLASAWVSANAGAGKTKVLTDRVVRLLLNGAPPARILCLTFTKAAAANMSIRVFRTLGRWVTLDDAALTAELTELTGAAPARRTLKAARRLFARAVETPGGLKIETLHALCERLLHMFPFEANVPARFQVLDENQAADLFAAETDRVLALAMTGRNPDLRSAWDRVGPEATGDTLRAILRAAMRAQSTFDGTDGLSGPLDALSRSLGLSAGETADTVLDRILTGGLDDWSSLAERLRTGKSTDEGLADRLIAAEATREAAARLDLYRSVFFTEKGTPKADRSLGTKDVPAEVKEALLSERDRLDPLFDTLRAAKALERTQALFVLVAEIHRRVERQKARLGALDFDDLIHKALDLLSRVDAAWVLYKLDRGIDHVLVDEAQDTNPRQWDILRRITADFASGEGAREGLRTRFAVGDPKQSIYSFQGAEPREFETVHREWRSASKQAGLAFEDVTLNVSFRSTKGILRAVDATFAVPEHYQGLSFDDTAVGTTHETARRDAPGVVEIWPVEVPAQEEEPDAWAAPVDAPEANAPSIVTARRVARAVKAWTTTGDEGGRVWRPGDVLILVRKRSAAFEEVIRALKVCGVPVAGQDRLDITAHIAVNDLVSIGRAGLLPADDLTLAGALKTPLVGLDDDDLVRIAARRDESETLEDALARHAAAGDPAALRGHEALTLWSDLAARHGPFGFYASLLGPHEGRMRLVARLGGEAGDAIDVFLMKAAEAEQASEAPSLDCFLTRYDSAPGRGVNGLTVKRDLESGRDEVRVMTIHGAKGLEAPVVVMIDGCEPLGRNDPHLLAMPGGRDGAMPPVWAGSKTQDTQAVAAAREAHQARAREEHNRLLYVALTRAADRLTVAPYRGHEEQGETAWCEMVRKGLEQAFGPGESLEAAYGPVLLWRDGPVRSVAAASSPAADAASAIPGWLRQSAGSEVEAAPPVSPSGALGAADGQRAVPRRQANPQARRRGILIHSLIEHLPRLDRHQRPSAASAFVKARAPSLPAAEQDRLVEDVLKLVNDPALAVLFDKDARAEVTISGHVSVGGASRPVFGRVDRLSIRPDGIVVADFKTSRPPSDRAPIPEDEAAQIALYVALLRDIYPGRPVEAMLVWTSGPVIRHLGEADIASALASLSTRPVHTAVTV
ncbi:double-strand break repair helicase AddA [Methylobacterium sp. W2]|uniref:double-strand break repair helicase AddA n=1 Tax=Methylobacterium sp. W2 TaxID=2598107 RepID=UPI001D0C3966|nr:double-strand break repair helicase AddA [Methylobacterium sp. W2]MCC0807747.1 double-strand break repair helicase AddA [Methylobacterium sp. W2]